MTDKEWDELEEKINLFNSETLKIDGYEVMIKMSKLDMKLVYSIFVDGWFKGKWLRDEENPIRDKFFWKRQKQKYPTKFVKATEKNMGKRYAKKNGYYDKYYWYVPWFQSFSTLKRTFVQNNDSIEWVRDSE